LRQKWKQYLKKWSLWSPFVSLWLGSCFVDFSGFSYFFGEFSGCFAGIRGAVLWISAVSATFFKNFPAFGLDWGAVLEVLWITAT
jgi:lipoprotein